LVENGAQINFESEDDYKLFEIFFLCEEIQIVKFVIHNGINLNKSSKNPLFEVCRYQRKEVIELLIEHGVDEKPKRKRNYNSGCLRKSRIS
jgi:ankyrin repeat protein